MSVVIRCKIEVNALTVPQSYKLRFVPNNHLGTDEIAASMTAINPALTPDLAKSAISALLQTLQQGLTFRWCRICRETGCSSRCSTCGRTARQARR